MALKFNWQDKRILVVEDEVMCYKLIEMVLRGTQVGLSWARNGRSAVELCSAENNAFDLILMDIQLPEIDGYNATGEIRKLNPGIPIIAQTAYAMDSQKEKCFAAGCTDYIAKPYNSNALLSIIDKYFQS